MGFNSDEAFRSTWSVNGKVVVELKSVAALADIHLKQLLTQLRLSGLKLGLLINFGWNPSEGWNQACHQWSA